MTVQAIARVAAPPDAAQDLMGSGVVFRLFKKIPPIWSYFVVMAGNGLLRFVPYISIDE